MHSLINGILFVLLFKTSSHCTQLPFRRLVPGQNMSCTPMTCLTMLQINDFGCSIAITPHQLLALLMPTSLHPLICLIAELCTTIYSWYNIGSILPTAIPLSMVLLSLQLQPFVGIKHEIVSIRLIGMSLATNPPCLSIRFLNLHMQTAAFIPSSQKLWQPLITSPCPLPKPFWHCVARQKVFNAPPFSFLESSGA